MDAAAGAFVFDGVLEVEHLVVEDVFDGDFGDAGGVEDAGEDDGVVGGVEVAEEPAGAAAAPAELGFGHEGGEVEVAEAVEEGIEVVVFAFGAGDVFAAADLADGLVGVADVAAVHEAAVVEEVGFGDAAAEEFGDEDAGEGFADGEGSGGDDFVEADLEFVPKEVDFAHCVDVAADEAGDVNVAAAVAQLVVNAGVECLIGLREGY